MEQPAVSTQGVKLEMSLSWLAHKQVKSVAEQPMVLAAVLMQPTAQLGSWAMRLARPVELEDAAEVVTDWAAARPEKSPKAMVYFMVTALSGFSLNRFWNVDRVMSEIFGG